MGPRALPQGWGAGAIPDPSCAVRGGSPASEKAVRAPLLGCLLPAPGEGRQVGKGTLQGLRRWGVRGESAPRACGESSRAPRGEHTCLRTRGSTRAGRLRGDAEGWRQKGFFFPLDPWGRHSASAPWPKDASVRGQCSPPPKPGFFYSPSPHAPGMMPGLGTPRPPASAEPPLASRSQLPGRGGGSWGR